MLLLFSSLVMSDSLRPWHAAACQDSLSLTISWSLPKFMFIASVMSSSHLILWHPLLLLPSIFPSIRDFSNESAVTSDDQWSFSIHPSNEFSGLISFKMDWFDLHAVQVLSGVFSTPQFESINSLVLCLLYSPALTTVHDHREDRSLDCTDFCWQSDVCFSTHCLGLS